MSKKKKLIVFVGVVVVMSIFSAMFPNHKEQLLFLAVVINVGFMQYHKS